MHKVLCIFSGCVFIYIFLSAIAYIFNIVVCLDCIGAIICVCNSFMCTVP